MMARARFVSWTAAAVVLAAMVRSSEVDSACCDDDFVVDGAAGVLFVVSSSSEPSCRCHGVSHMSGGVSVGAGGTTTASVRQLSVSIPDALRSSCGRQSMPISWGTSFPHPERLVVKGSISSPTGAIYVVTFSQVNATGAFANFIRLDAAAPMPGDAELTVTVADALDAFQTDGVFVSSDPPSARPGSWSSAAADGCSWMPTPVTTSTGTTSTGTSSTGTSSTGTTSTGTTSTGTTSTGTTSTGTTSTGTTAVFTTGAAPCLVPPPPPFAVGSAAAGSYVASGQQLGYSCSAGYSRTAGDASRTCLGGAFGGTAPVCSPNPCPTSAPAFGSVAPPSSAPSGTSATYSCGSGYTLSGASSRLCTAGVLAGTLPTCTANACTTVTPANGAVVPSPSVPSGSSATYSCVGGYTLSGASNRLCTAGTLAGSQPTCGANPCPTTAPAFGSVAPPSSAPSGTSATYSCSSGYTLSGASSRACTAGVLAGVLPACNANPCTTSPSPANGNVVPWPSVASGSVATYTCNGGYTLSGMTTRSCTLGTLSGVPPVCNPNPCVTSVPTGGTVSQSLVPSGSTVTYTCLAGYTMSGSNTLTCTAGSLSGPPPTCSPNPCTATPPPANGNVVPPSVPSGSVATYTCNGGYTLSGMTTRSCTLGTLSGAPPVCNANPCATSAPAGGTVSQSPLVPSGSSVTYTCLAGYTMSGVGTLTCTAGALSGPPPACTAAPCATTAPPNGFVSPATSVPHGGTATYTCAAGYTLSGASSRVCSFGSLSAVAPTCVVSPCTVAAPRNGTVTPFPSVPSGSQASYSCTTGFLLNGTSTRSCNAGILAGIQPNCQPSPCTTTQPLNGFVSAPSVPSGTTATYSCSAGYTLGGSSARLCTLGTLAGTQPTCTGAPCTAAAPAYGGVSATTVLSGNSATYSCITGYTLNGASSRLCTTGTLAGTQPTCTPSPCAVPVLANGMATPAGSVASGAMVVHNCTGGYTLSGPWVRACNFGTLSGTAPTCDSIAVGTTSSRGCRVVPPENGFVNGGTATITVSHNQQVTYSCVSGFALNPTGSGTRTCTNGALGVVPNCVVMLASKPAWASTIAIPAGKTRVAIGHVPISRWRACTDSRPVCALTDGTGIATEPCVGNPYRCDSNCTIGTPDSRLLQLIARLDAGSTTGTPVIVGNANTLAIAAGKTVVKLGPNDWDGCYGDNQGSISVAISFS